VLDAKAKTRRMEAMMMGRRKTKRLLLLRDGNADREVLFFCE
jgi:hypothetical protein